MDQKRSLGVCYYPEHWPEQNWVCDADTMKALGLTYVRIGEFAWSRIEPNPGEYQWGWLDRAIEVLGQAGLKVVLCTPTPTPPYWLTQKEPGILRHDEDGLPMKHGTRRHVSMASEAYRFYSRQMTEALAKRYGNNPHVAGWQTDNEYGCHDSTLSYGPEDRKAFCKWLAQRYDRVADLNEAWGNVFWSQEYRHFDEVDLPHRAQAALNPAHWLAFRRFFSDMTAEFNREQCQIIRQYSSDRWITHNFMVNETSFDHWTLAQDLDFASWDSYPLGFLEFFGRDFGLADDALVERYMCIGHPDIAGFQHDLYRSIGQGRFWVMEQQPGPVNWSTYNPAPVDGAVRFWSLEAFAHGAETVSYFRWRQAPWSQEQYHTGLNRWDGSPDQAFEEVGLVAQDLAALPEVTAQSTDWDRTVAILMDYDSVWQLEAAKQGESQDFTVKLFQWYHAVRRMGFNIDIVQQPSDTKARLVINPFTAAIAKSAFPGQIVLNGTRSGTRSEEASMAHRGIAKVLRTESLRPSHQLKIDLEKGGSVFGGSWAEHLADDPELIVHARFRKSQYLRGPKAAWVEKEGTHYLAFDPAFDGVQAILEAVMDQADLKPISLNQDVRLRWTKTHVFVLNFGQEAFDVSKSALGALVVSAKEIAPHQVAWFERQS